MSESNFLFNDFAPISDETWREKVIEDLKGKDFEKTLVWEDENGIQHQPFYTLKDIENRDDVTAIREAQKTDSHWEIIQVFPASSGQLSVRISKALKNGVDKIVVSGVNQLKETKEAIGSDSLNKENVHLDIKEISRNSVAKNYFCDPIGEMITRGQKNEKDLEALAGIFQKRLNQLKPDNFLLIDGTLYKNAGSSIVQELALSLHHALEYLDYLTDKGYTAEAVARSFTFKLGIGTSYFSEIAKLRAFRFLVRKLFSAYDVSSNKVKIWGESSSYYHAHLDPYTNLLRLSTQCMSAILGNCDLISLKAFDEWEKSSILGRRMAKNIPLILKHESYFQKVSDMASGAYYIESLSATLAEKAWQAFLEMEETGGLLKSLENNSLGELLEKTRKERVAGLKATNKGMIGVTKYPNVEAKELTVHLPKSNGVSPQLLSKDLLA
jgi:methylmalonyl-CoA mutase